jgi:hypothetical protein
VQPTISKDTSNADKTEKSLINKHYDIQYRSTNKKGATAKLACPAGFPYRLGAPREQPVNDHFQARV